MFILRWSYSQSAVYLHKTKHISVTGLTGPTGIKPFMDRASKASMVHTLEKKKFFLKNLKIREVVFRWSRNGFQ